MKRSKLIKLLIVCLVVVTIILFVSLPVRVARYGKAKIVSLEAAESGIVIIFGAGLKSNGTPSDVLDDRLQTGSELFATGKATQILVSGDNRVENYNEPQVMHDTLVSKYNVPTERITIDFGGRRTYDTCIRAKTLWNVDKAILVTQSFHLPRALWTCDQLGVESVGVSASLQTYVRDRSYRFREILATYKAFIDVYVRTPDYLEGEFEDDLGSVYAE